MSETEMKPAMRTKPRYAHELFPHPAEDEIRSLEVELPYLYARAVGLQSINSGWMDDKSAEGMQRGYERIESMIAAQSQALLADALLQGLTGDEASRWAAERNCADNGGEWVWERAVQYGVNPDLIKPYPCGPERAHHDHMASTGNSMGHGIVTRIDGRESDCPDCCEPVDSTYQENPK